MTHPANLTTLIYSALLDPSRWQVFLDQAAAEIGGAKMQLHGWTDAEGAMLSATTGYDPAMIAQYERHLRRLNPWTQKIIQSPEGAVLSSEELYPEEKLKRSLFYEEWLRPQEDIVAGAGVVIGRTPSGPFMFGGNIRERDREIKHPYLLEMMGQLAPHLTLAWRVGRAMLGPQVQLIATETNAVGPRAALILLRLDRTVAFADDAGELLLGAEDLCKINYCGRFALRHLLAEDALAAAMRALANGDAPVVVRVPAVDGLPSIYLIGLDHDCVRDWPLATLLCLPRRSLLCVIERSVPSRQVAHLAGIGLTLAEQEVAKAIAQGEGTAAVAEQRGVSVTTVRSQVQAIYSKCGINNRAALTALVLGAHIP